MMTLDKRSIALLYRKRAKLYDFSANAYYLLGFREFAYRKIGVKALSLKKGAAALSPDARFVIVDFKKTDRWPMWMIKLLVILTRPFGVSLDIADRHPWESVARYMTIVEFRELYFEALYLCVGNAL